MLGREGLWNGTAAVDEVVLGVNVALGLQPVAVCAAVDADANGFRTVDELIAAVNSTLRGCPVAG